MDNLRAAIEILFSRVNPEEVIQQDFSVPRLSLSEEPLESRFVNIYETLEDGHNKDEIKSIFDILNGKWIYPVELYPAEMSRRKNVFYALLFFASKMLYEENDHPVCEFGELLRWHELTGKLGEDLFTTAYFAYKDLNSKRSRHYFSWPSLISSNNRQLHEVLHKGMAELHFHLKGSSPYFELNWLSLMNHIKGRRKEFLQLRNSKMPDANPWYGEKQLSLYGLCIKAFAIRQLLFRVFIKEIQSEPDGIRRYKNILRCTDEDELVFAIDYLQPETDRLRYQYGRHYGKEQVDYAIPENLAQKNYEDRCFSNTVFSGERWLMYKMFTIIFLRDKKRCDLLQNLFYAYLIIKERVRREIVQVNNYPGFANFQEYQRRKEIFLAEGSIYYRLFINMAITSTLANKDIKYLEARIPPRKTANEIFSNVQKNDSYICDPDLNMPDKSRYFTCKLCPAKKSKTFCNCKCAEDEQQKYFYVLHFIKNSETKKYHGDISGIAEYVKPRDSELRKSVKEQAMAINIMRRQTNKTKSRIVGIDAASSEIGCRPEVFSQAFRYLRYYSHEMGTKYLVNSPFMQLGFTYHAGEDFLDIADGLRAIDETILFLGFQRGDRIGHALALGISPEDYYERKHKQVILSRQNFLDNVVWILAKIKQYDISVSQSLIQKLNTWYIQLYHDIYDKEVISNGHVIDLQLPDIYYQAWLLRGDCPDLYFKEDTLRDESYFNPSTFWGRYGLNATREIFRIARKDRLVRALYKAYHYSIEVKRRGAENQEFRISDDYIHLMGEIQKAMCFDIAKMHIVIEANPTSNKLIGAYKRYAAHPIVRFFNLGLVSDIDEIQACPQLCVSLNTDDQGVFATNLENEYALMAIALEKEKDCDGKPLYNSRMIYDWLDRIRTMGLEQRFNKEELGDTVF